MGAQLGGDEQHGGDGRGLPPEDRDPQAHAFAAHRLGSRRAAGLFGWRHDFSDGDTEAHPTSSGRRARRLRGISCGRHRLAWRPLPDFALHGRGIPGLRCVCPGALQRPRPLCGRGHRCRRYQPHAAGPPARPLGGVAHDACLLLGLYQLPRPGHANHPPLRGVLVQGPPGLRRDAIRHPRGHRLDKGSILLAESLWAWPPAALPAWPPWEARNDSGVGGPAR
mmetsp:Transcript_52777/g.153499  ORF Transcript_52777/g.153499 Transcript_52777/m.153499 type:complete len:223 (-) Transcript_52777:791-1459(-)